MTSEKGVPVIDEDGGVPDDDLTATIDVPPHPRLLSVLGDIEFQPWQCLAELIDNGFDDFLKTPAAEREARPTVQVTLPSRNSSLRDAEVWVRDNGRGMTREQLRNSLRAGWSDNNRFGSLGLFGMGFNIATARLGHVAVVRTTRRGDPVWQVVTIDLRKLAAGEDFLLPVVTETKDSPEQHGTEVLIRDLKQEHFETLRRGQKKIKTTLGNVYSYLLTERGYHLIVDGEAVKPRRACVWDRSRAVVRSGDRIPAVIDIDEPLPDKIGCLDCGAWQQVGDTATCENCDSGRLEVQQRRIWGWVGVQRYLSKQDFGIDFIRNGRKILIGDLTMFQWVDPDDPGSRGVVEYPVEVPTGSGRIVGEIHVDHVRVNYQKNAFEYDTPDWKRVVRALRGEGPLLPKSGKTLGYDQNRSPLARLVSGYRRNNPGLNYLTPGDGKGPIHEKTKEWADLFHSGDPAYQTDDIWYQAARLHDNPPPPPPPPGDAAPNPDILNELGLTPGATPAAGPPPPPKPAVDTEDERRQRWRHAGRRVPDMEGKFGLRGQGAAADVTCWLVIGQRVTRPGGDAVPVYVASGRGAAVEVFIDADHPVFTDFAADLRDLILIELAEYLRVRNNDTGRSLSAMFAALKNECLPDQKLGGPQLAAAAMTLLARIRELMAPVVAGNSTGYWSLLPPDDQKSTEQIFAYEGGREAWDDALANGAWVDFAPGSALARLVSTRPESFLDGRVFVAAHNALTDPDAKRLATERIVDLLRDVASLADRPIRRSPEELQRGRLSCRLLELDLVSDAEPEPAVGERAVS